jgi:predicted  nucleic acid-binding Zn-ribbon protein
MPTDTLGDEAQTALKSALDFIRLNRPDDRKRRNHLVNLESIEERLRSDIGERETTYANELQSKEDQEIDEAWRELNEDQRFVRVNTEQKARQQTFESLRQVNDGTYPTNISPVIYAIPLILIGIAEWYVNLSTFTARFVPLVAGAGTILVALIFATASHFQGEFFKQLSEILHPSVEYRNELGRKIAVTIATILLVAAFSVVIWLRYQVIADQLGLNSESAGTFGGSSTSIVWANLGPTIGLNLFVWGLGVLYAFLFSEKVPKLRKAFRDLQFSNKQLDKARRPFVREQKRIKAEYDRERQKNEVAVKEYGSLSEEMRGAIKRLQG